MFVCLCVLSLVAHHNGQTFVGGTLTLQLVGRRTGCFFFFFLSPKTSLGSVRMTYFDLTTPRRKHGRHADHQHPILVMTASCVSCMLHRSALALAHRRFW